MVKSRSLDRKLACVIKRGRGRLRLSELLGPDGVEFLIHGLTGFDRLMPHVETRPWELSAKGGGSRVTWQGPGRRKIQVALQLTLGGQRFRLTTLVTRKSAPSGVGKREWTLDEREADLCRGLTRRLSGVLRDHRRETNIESLRSVQGHLDENVVAGHLASFQGLNTDVRELLAALRRLAEQSYENKALSFGVVFGDGKDGVTAGETERPVFPGKFLEKKRYRALSDGYRTAYVLDRHGRVQGLRDLEDEAQGSGAHFFPEPFRYLAGSSWGTRCGFGLTRQGDVLVFAGGTLRFTYRVGRWQYWNHSHVCNLFQSRARVQNVSRSILPKVARAIYRLALDVSFRRTGALFVLLRNQKSLHQLVVSGDGVGDESREAVHEAFDRSLGGADVVAMSRSVLTELAGLDGGMILSNKGRILAYAAVLKTSGKFSPSEGSRTKAAISAGRFGIAVKVSADGDIAFYEGKKAKPFLEL